MIAFQFEGGGFYSAVAAVALFWGLALGANTAEAQTEGSAMPIGDKTSPTAASLGTFADVQVDLYTGRPQTRIPIHEIKVGDLSHQITLQRQGGGVKVASVPSWVGAGWALSAGGAITRRVRGLPDEYTSGYMNVGSEIDDHWEHMPFSSSDEDTQAWGEFISFLQGTTGLLRDSQPDKIFYNFGGRMGQIIIGKDGKARPSPYNRLKIEIGPIRGDFNDATSRWDALGISYFKITTPKGVVYKFSEREYSYQNVSANRDHVSTWHLTKIKKGNNEINISYKEYTTGSAYESIISRKKKANTKEYYGTDGFCDLPSGNVSNVNKIYKPKLISEITSRNKEINFLSSPRNGYQSEKEYKLDKIGVRNKNGRYKSILFNYNKRNIFKGRLMLGSVNVDSRKFSFEYVEQNGLPSRMSTNIDFWGYYNGASNGYAYIPSVRRRTRSGDVITFDGANRTPNANYMKAGALRKIDYPTGGSSTYYYEPHRYYDIGIGTLTERGKKLKNYDTTEKTSGEASSKQRDDSGDGKQSRDEVGFEVSSTESQVTLNVDVDYKTDGLEQSDCISYPQFPCVEVKILDSSGTTLEKYVPEFNTELPPGVYLESSFSTRVSSGDSYSIVTIAREPAEADNTVEVKAQASWTETREVTNGDIMAGGLRVRKVVKRAGAGDTSPKVKVFSYEQASSSQTSGALETAPRFHYRGVSGNCVYYVHHASPVTGLGTTKGGPVGYGRVKVIYGEDRRKGYGFSDSFTWSPNGWKVYDFISPVEVTSYKRFGKYASATSPSYGAPYPDLHYITGKRESVSEYKYLDDGYPSGRYPIQKKIWNYIAYNDWENINYANNESNAQKAIYAKENPPDSDGQKSTYYHRYRVGSPWVYTKSKKVKRYTADSNGTVIDTTSTTTTYYPITDTNSAAFKGIRTVVKTSHHGRVRATRYKYAAEKNTERMGPGGTHQVAQKYRTTVFRDANTNGQLDDWEKVYRRSWTEWMENPNASSTQWVPKAEWVWMESGN